MTKRILVLIMLCCGAYVGRAQYSEFSDNALNTSASKFMLSSDNNILQIGGRVSGFYQLRILKDDTSYNNKKNNGFQAKDFDLNFQGKTAGKFAYELHVSVLDIVTAATSQNTLNADNPGVKAGYLAYKGWPVHIKFGFDKLPYSQGSMSDVWGTPYWSHAHLFGGDLFSRRDFGLTLNYRFFKDRINVYGGAYSGMGEYFFQYGNDASGRPEYIGRIEYSHPGKMKYHIIDHEVSAKPTYRIAVNARYADKTQPAGQSIYDDAPVATGKYGIRMVNGTRLAYGFDGILQYKGLSVTAEGHMIQLRPTDSMDAVYEGTTTAKNKSVVNASGLAVGANYAVDKIKSVFSAQYEYINVNDLATGYQEWFYLGYAYKVAGFNSVFKIQWYLPLTEDEVSNPIRYTSQIRIGYQLVF